MDNKKMAQFISQLRKEKNLTQRQLAEQLNVTDKAVSKWERGLSCPDITLLPALSDILGVTTGELLNGAKAEVSVPEIETIVETALQYADTATKKKAGNNRLVLTMVISAISLLAVIVCIICNYAIEGNLSWALFPISSIIFVLLVTMPLILWIKKRTIMSLTMFSVLIVPFLFVLEKIIGAQGLLMPVGMRVSAIAVIYLWLIFFLFSNSKVYKYVSTAIALFAGLPVTWGINTVVSKFTGQPATDIWDVLTYSILGISGIAVFIFGYAKEKSIIKTSNVAN